MDYFLNQQGKAAGVFPLQELRRRRDAGEISGTDLVWREGMAQWQTLDSVLAEAPVATTNAPPPLPRPSAKQGPSKLVIWGVVAAIVFMLAMMITFGWIGFKAARIGYRQARESSSGDGVNVASQPIKAGTNSLTEAKATQRSRAFRVRQYLEAYRQIGERDDPCAKEAEHFIEVWIDKNYGGPQETNRGSVEQLGRKLVDSSGCTDPIVLTVAGVCSSELHESTRYLEKAVAGFEKTKYRGYSRFYANVELAEKLSEHRDRAARYWSAAPALLEQAMTDGSFSPDDQPELAEILINSWGYNFFYRYRQRVCDMARQHEKTFPWLALVLDGEYHVIEAWAARGGGYANTVTAQGWQGFRTHLAAARKSFMSAWKLRPDLPLAPCRMIYVAMGQSGAEEMREWFDRTLAAQIDYPRAWRDMRWGLRPRWHGSLDALRALGVEAVNTKRFDTDVPRKFFDIVKDIESESQLAPREHIYGRSDIWPHLQQMYQGYIEASTNAWERDGWRSTYTSVAYLAERYDVAREQLEALDWKPRTWNLSGWGADLSLLPMEVAARTSSASNQIEQAEARYQEGPGADAWSAYDRLSRMTGLDERAMGFIRSRLASLEQEKRLQQGEWIDLLPGSEKDPDWVFQLGSYHCPTNGCLEVETGDDGSFCFSRTRVGSEFEIKGEFEVVRTSNQSFQAGVVLVDSDYYAHDWQAFRIKRNPVEGDVVCFAQGWTKKQAVQHAQLKEDRNTFDFRLQKGKATAIVNGEKLLADDMIPGSKALKANPSLLLGLGAYHDSNETVIRYHNVQVRRLGVATAEKE